MLDLHTFIEGGIKGGREGGRERLASGQPLPEMVECDVSTD